MIKIKLMIDQLKLTNNISVSLIQLIEILHIHELGYEP